MVVVGVGLSYGGGIDGGWFMAGKDVTKLSSKYQISIPKSVREKHKWKAGQEFAFVPSGNGVVLVPVPTLDDLVGIMRGASTEDIRDHEDVEA